MKICQLCAVDFTLYHFLLPLMDGMRAAGHDVVGVCADGPLLEKVRTRGIRVEPVAIARSLNLARHFRAYRALVKFFKRERFDVVHVHTPVAAMIGRAAAWRAGVKHVAYTAHGFYFHERMAAWKRAIVVMLEWLGGRLTDTLFTQSEEDAAAARRLHLGPKQRIWAIGNGVDAAAFHPPADAERAAIRAEFGTPDDRVVIAMVGRLVAEKGYPELFAAMRHVDAELWVIGERLASDHASSIDAALAQAETDAVLRGRIRLLGYRGDVARLLRGADIYTLPSHREGMPRSIIEAMMTGLPVVATNIRGSREEVVPQATGLLVPVNDVAELAAALNRLVDDAAMRARFGAAGRARALDLYDERKVIARQIEWLGLAQPGAPHAR